MPKRKTGKSQNSKPLLYVVLVKKMGQQFGPAEGTARWPKYHALTYAGGGRWVRAFYVLLQSRVTGGLEPGCGNSRQKGGGQSLGGFGSLPLSQRSPARLRMQLPPPKHKMT